MTRKRTLSPKPKAEVTYSPSINLVPRRLWGVNLRAFVGKTKIWRELREAAIEEDRGCCHTCGKSVVEWKDLNAHEEWEYEASCDPAIATLVGIRAVCGNCHAIEHFGRTVTVMERGEMTEDAYRGVVEHFCALNHATEDDLNAHFEEALATFNARSQLRWVVEWGEYAMYIPRDHGGDRFEFPEELE
jgi:hypothetical protein